MLVLSFTPCTIYTCVHGFCCLHSAFLSVTDPVTEKVPLASEWPEFLPWGRLMWGRLFMCPSCWAGKRITVLSAENWKMLVSVNSQGNAVPCHRPVTVVLHVTLNQEATADNSFTIEFWKLFGILHVFTIESIAVVFWNKWFLFQLALNLRLTVNP